MKWLTNPDNNITSREQNLCIELSTWLKIPSQNNFGEKSIDKKIIFKWYMWIIGN